MEEMSNSIFQPFEPIKYLYTSLFELELILSTRPLHDKHKHNEESKTEETIKRNLNLREIINLQLAERAQRHGFRSIDNKIYLGDIKDLANFILYKIKTSNIFNVTLTLKHDEEQDDNINIDNFFN